MFKNKIDLNELDWEDLPTSFDGSGTCDNLKIAYIDEYDDDDPNRDQIIASVSTQEHDLGKAELAVCLNGKWFSTSSVGNWGKLDELFSRDQWKQFLIDYAADNPLDACYYESKEDREVNYDYSDLYDVNGKFIISHSKAKWEHISEKVGN